MWRASPFLILCLLTSGWAHSARADESWVGVDGVTEEAVSRLVQKIEQDPQGAELVQQASQHALETTGGPFWKVVSVCTEKVDPRTSGQTQSGAAITIRLARDVEETAIDLNPNGETKEDAANAYYKARIDQARAKNGVPAGAPYLVRYYPDVIAVKAFTQEPGICLQAKLSVNQAVSVLFHEMVHYVATDLKEWVPLENFRDEADYEFKTVLNPGDEVDAYVSQWSYALRTGELLQVPVQVLPFFAKDGTFIPYDSAGNDHRKAIARLILDGPIFSSGIGYSVVRFRDEYVNALNSEERSHDNLYKYFLQVQELRRKNLPYFQQQAKIAASRSASEGERAQANLQEDQISITRLDQEEKDCQARMDQLNGLISQWNQDQARIKGTR